MKKQTYVTQPFMPPLSEFVRHLEKIWESKLLTNGGPFHEQLEKELCAYLGVGHISLFSNGTIALISALQALQITEEVITTPFSFVATTHSLIWNGNRPVFVDINPITLNIDPEKIEAAITPQTRAIMPVHCYGNPCDTNAIKKIADKYDLRVIYDAAHAFGVTDASGTILRHGDLSVLSFHATKVFNTFEGGAIIAHDKKTKNLIDNLKNFGIVDETTVIGPGINGKMSEINASFGLLQLKYVDQAINRRAEVDRIYRERLDKLPGITCLPKLGQHAANFSYFPILVTDSFALDRDNLYHLLKKCGINSRRYFYPLISEYQMYRGLPSASESNLPVATAVAKKILCLPIYPELDPETQERIIRTIESA
jgi:dTDP-4-amino-4,6-dideoxygalactose transaminase